MMAQPLVNRNQKISMWVGWGGGGGAGPEARHRRGAVPPVFISACVEYRQWRKLGRISVQFVEKTFFCDMIRTFAKTPVTPTPRSVVGHRCHAAGGFGNRPRSPRSILCHEENPACVKPLLVLTLGTAQQCGMAQSKIKTQGEALLDSKAENVSFLLFSAKARMGFAEKGFCIRRWMLIYLSLGIAEQLCGCVRFGCTRLVKHGCVNHGIPA